MTKLLTRRNLLIAGGVGAGGLIASNWGAIATSSTYGPLVRLGGDTMSMHLQRLALFHRPLAKEYRRGQISKNHPQTGGIGSNQADPNPAFNALAARGFRDWRLKVGGLVERPMSYSLEQLRAMPHRSQITMHSCDEGWSAIGEWTGVQVAHLLALSGLKPGARYVVFRCLDTVMGMNWWGSIDLLEAVHPQTILAHQMNGEPLPVKHGAPVRLRLELQIGYKNLKHINEIEVVDSIKDLAGGFGGLAESIGYQWYAGQ